eukprot:COSAG05_NODE_540_length_8845_cov_13.872742_4_plen_223_part_00
MKIWVVVVVVVVVNALLLLLLLLLRWLKVRRFTLLAPELDCRGDFGPRGLPGPGRYELQSHVLLSALSLSLTHTHTHTQLRAFYRILVSLEINQSLDRSGGLSLSTLSYVYASIVVMVTVTTMTTMTTMAMMTMMMTITMTMMMDGRAAIMREFVQAVAPTPLWAGETNSISCGGAPGVSDTYASTLWVLDYLAEMSKAGVVGANFHGGPDDACATLTMSNI